MPSVCIPHSSYPVMPGTLVGAFTDSVGRIVGSPFKVGNGPTTLTVPQGAGQLQLGVNDSQYSDNNGAWDLEITAE